MAVTLYRCQKCRGLFNAVFEPNKWCRDCKLNQTSGGASKASLATLSGVVDAKELTIIEPEEDAMGGGKEGVSGAIGGYIGDPQGVFAQQQAQQFQNASGMQSLMGQAAQQGVFSGGSEIRSPFIYSDSSLKPGESFQFNDGTTRTITSVSQLDNERIMIVDNLREVTVKDAPSLWPEPKRLRSPIKYAPPPDPKPESSPHESILRPSRKLKLAAE